MTSRAERLSSCQEIPNISRRYEEKLLWFSVACRLLLMLGQESMTVLTATLC